MLAILESVFGTLTYILMFSNLRLGSSGMSKIEECTCEGYEQTYECRVQGGGATVWTGTVLDCPNSNNEIVLLSANFGTRVCNYGAIVGRLIRSENSTYVSRLTISVSAEMVGLSISCFHDSGNAVNLIGSSVIRLTRDQYPAPSDLHLINATSTHLTFQWNGVASNCMAIHYHINVSNCGLCPSITNGTTVTCWGVFPNGHWCIFAIKTIVCDNIVGNESSSVKVALKTPDAPVVDVIPTYLYKTKKLIALTTRFNELEPFNISESVDGTATSYSITYTNSITGVVCTSAIMSSSSCVSGSCEHKLRLRLSSCSDKTDISVRVSGTNRIGNGSPSTPVSASGVTNHFVDLSFDPPAKITTCLFLNQPNVYNEAKSCSIVYGIKQRKTCNMLVHKSNKSLSDKVYLRFPEKIHFSQSQNEHCFIVTASNGTYTVIVKGLLPTERGTSTCTHSSSIGMLPFGACVGAMLLTMIVITSIFILVTAGLVRSRRSVRVNLNARSEQSAIYEEVDQCAVAKPAAGKGSLPAIITGQNTAYLTFSGVLTNV